jgi:hypothetical protein
MADDSGSPFRISVWRPWLLAVAMLAVPVLLGAALAAAGGQPDIAGVALVGLVVAAGALLLPITWGVCTSRWDVDETGIGGRDNWHVYRRVNWAEIRSISHFPFPGYPLIWVNTADRRWVFWLPLFLTDMPGFRAAIARYANPENPLLQFLTSHPD